MRTTGLLLLYSALAAFGTYLTFQPTFDSCFVRVQTERGDGMLNHYILENSWLAARTDYRYSGRSLILPRSLPSPAHDLQPENLFGTAPLYWAAQQRNSHSISRTSRRQIRLEH